MKNAHPAHRPQARPPDDTRLRLLLRAFRHRNFRLFFGGQLLSLIGTWMQSAAQAWLVYRLTDSAVLLGLVAFAGQVPVFLFAPVGGMVADRRNRLRILLATQTSAMLLAFILAALTLTGAVTIGEVLLLTLLLGITSAFDIPTRQSFIVELVGKEDLQNAIALNSSMVNGARIAGPALAGVTVAAVGEGWCFFINGVSYIPVLVGLLLIRIAPRRVAAAKISPFAHLREGFDYVRRTRPVKALLVLLGLVSLTGMPYAVLMPIFAGRILHGGPQALGLLMAASGVGALIGALSLAARRGLRGLGTWVVASAGAFGLSLILFSLSRSFWLSCLLLLPVGFFVMVQMAASNTLIQAMVPDALRGRVMAFYSMMFMGMAPFGALLAGALAHPLGAPATVALGGAASITGAFFFWKRLPDLRAEARQILITQNAIGGEPPEELAGSSTT